VLLPVLQQFIAAVSYCHANNVAHRSVASRPPQCTQKLASNPNLDLKLGSTLLDI